MIKTLRLVLYTCLYFLLTSCIAFRGSGTKDLLENEFSSPSDKISINFSNNSFVRNESIGDIPSEKKPFVEGYMLSASKFFITTQSLKGEEDFHFNFKSVYLEESNSFLKQLPKNAYLCLSLLSLSVIPYYWKNHRELQVEVIKNEEILKTYSYKDYMNNLAFLLALPFWRYSEYNSFWSGENEEDRKLNENLVRNFLEDFYKDFLL